MATQLKNLLNSWCLMEGWEGLVLLAIWFQWLCTKLMGLFFFYPFFKISLKSSYSSLLFFFFVLAVGATEERPEPSLKMFFFLFLKLSFCDFGNRA